MRITVQEITRLDIHPVSSCLDEKQDSQLISVFFPVASEGEEETYQKYVSKLRTDFQKKTYQVASKAADKSHQKNKRLHDKRVQDQILEEGDRVLMRNLRKVSEVSGKSKLGKKWSSLPYVVISKMPNLPCKT